MCHFVIGLETFQKYRFFFAIVNYKKDVESYFRKYISQYRNPTESEVRRGNNHPIINMPVHVLGPLNKGKS